MVLSIQRMKKIKEKRESIVYGHRCQNLSITGKNEKKLNIDLLEGHMKGIGYVKREKLRYTQWGSPFEFKHLIVLTDKAQEVLSFLRTNEFNAAMFLNLIGEPNILHLRYCI